ncbi:MAG: transcription antitermination factor NusB [Gemmatimonadota bacterium]|jgi:N utilization substance protein B|nr:transcription antitermination factor NusB [Gemmatimonadota bacterium]
MRASSRARGWALQGLYAWEMRGEAEHDAVRVLQELFSELRVSPQNRPFAEVLVRLVAANRVRIDAVLDESLTNWRLGRLSTIDRNLLRLGTAELMYLEEGTPSVTIREMIRLAERYGTPESPRFVNGVLDAVARRFSPREAASRP